MGAGQGQQEPAGSPGEALAAKGRLHVIPEMASPIHHIKAVLSPKSNATRRLIPHAHLENVRGRSLPGFVPLHAGH